jgi:leucyl-tRNA synthetase
VEGQAAPPPLSPAIGDQRDENLERLLHKTIKKVTEDIRRFAYNTAIAQMIVWSNEAGKAKAIGRDQIERFIVLLSPFAPHLCEELWHRLGHDQSLTRQAWPTYDEALTRDQVIEMAVQVRGKLRDRITVPADATDEQVVAAALKRPNVAREIGDKPVKRSIVVRGRLVNLII